jgi:hypothetical protein
LCIPIGETQAEKSAVIFIVLIVFIVTLFLNEAKSFSLFNATQILSIPISENPAVVFIVLIVLIGTHCLSEAMPFSLINVVQILYPQIKIDQASVATLSRHHPAWSFCYQKFINFSVLNTLDFLRRLSD